MAFDVNRWLKYAKARIDSAIGQGNSSLDRLEAEREADLADKPWLRADGGAPTLDEAKARIQWEAERQEAGARGRATPGGGTGAAPGDPQDQATAADAEGARLQLEARERASAERLDAIRKELGVVDPPKPGDDAPPPA